MLKNNLKCAIFVFIALQFAAVNAKKVSQKAETMTRLRGESGVVMINDKNLKSLVLSKYRDYHLLLLFTVSRPDRQCPHCNLATEAFEEIALNWKMSENFDASLFFAKSDFDQEGMQVFQTFQVNTAPLVYFLHANGKQQHTLFMEKYGFSPEGYADFIEKATGTKIEIEKPINFAPLIALSIVLLFLTITIKYGWVKIEVVEELIGTSVSVLSVVFISMMSSGFMWNHMRGAPLWQQDGAERVYIDKWMDNQLVAESFIILALNLLIGAGMVIMSEGGKPGARKTMCAWGGLLVTVTFYYTMWSIFTDKYQGYPKAFFFL